MASVAPNKSLIDRDRLIKKLTPEQLKQLIQQNPQSTEATLALARLNELKEFSERGRGMQGEAPSMRDQLLTYNHGIGNTPMRPPSNMAMAAQGGLIGFQDKGLVEDPDFFSYDNLMPDRFKDGVEFDDFTGYGSDALQYARENPGKTAAGIAGAALTLPALGASGTAAGIYGLGRAGLYGLGRLGKPLLKYADKQLRNFGQKGFKGNIPKRSDFKSQKEFDEALKEFNRLRPDFARKSDIPTGFKPKSPGRPPKVDPKPNATDAMYFKPLKGGKTGPPRFDRARYEKALKKWNKNAPKQKANLRKYNEKVQQAKEADRKQLEQIYRRKGLERVAKGVSVPAIGYGGYKLLQEDADTRTRRKLAEDDPDGISSVQASRLLGLTGNQGRGSGAITDTDPTAGMSMEPKKRSFLSDALIRGGLQYASDPNANIGSAALAGVDYATKRRDQMTDREKLAFDRETKLGVARLGLLKAQQLDPTDRLRIQGLVNDYRSDMTSPNYGLNSDLTRFNEMYEEPLDKLEGLNRLLSELGQSPITEGQLTEISGGAGVDAALNKLVSDAFVARHTRDLVSGAAGRAGI
jgi:hypothetical protein